MIQQARKRTRWENVILVVAIMVVVAGATLFISGAKLLFRTTKRNVAQSSSLEDSTAAANAMAK